MTDGSFRDAEEIKARALETFGRSASNYVESRDFAAGEDLQRLLEWADPHAGTRALDVSTGGGHVAATLAPRVRHVTASDLTPRMLEAARTHIRARELENVDFVVADAEALPFLDESFDLVTCRIAAHHYPDVPRALSEMARVLVAGGRLILIDNVVPEDPYLSSVVNGWERQRDPSHVRCAPVSEWLDRVKRAGLDVLQVEVFPKRYDFDDWTGRVGMTAEAAAELTHQMLGAPSEVRQSFHFEEKDGRVVSWATRSLILAAARAV